MEASRQGQPLRLVLEYEPLGAFRIDPEERFEFDEGAVIEIARRQTELEAQLRTGLAEDPLLASVEVRNIEVRRGSVLLEVLAVLHDVGTWVAYFGGLVQGLDYLGRAIHRIARPFLAPFIPGLLLAGVHFQVLPPLLVPPVAPAPGGNPRLVLYLLAANAVLCALLIAVVIVVVIVRGT